MHTRRQRLVPALSSAAIALLLGLPACGGKEEAQTRTEPAHDSQAASSDSPSQLDATAQTWSPEQMEELLAPIALYPDPILSQVLLASTNPQEVLDAGNWLLENQSLKGAALASAAGEKGFTPPVLALIQSPETLDMMCREMGWTEELGQAYVNDQAAVLAAVQRLRAQAKDVGNLKSSEQMTVKEETQNGQAAITISPPSSQVVYVPVYDPVAVYAPATTAPAPAAAPAEQKSSGSDTGSLAATALLAFGAGILIAEAFDDDYYHSPYGYPSYWGPPMPYYPPYPYRPPYGGGFYPAHGYRPPGNYNHNFNNNTIIINQENNYWNRFDASKPRQGGDRGRSPISEAQPNRPELNQLNAEAAKGPKHRAADPPKGWSDKASPAVAKDRSGPTTGQSATKGSAQKSKVQGTYVGSTTRAAKPGAGSGAASSKAQAGYAGSKGSAGSKVQGTYAGATTSSVPRAGAQQQHVDRGQENRDASSRSSPSSPKEAAARPAASSGASGEARAPASRPATTTPAAAKPSTQRPSSSTAKSQSRTQSSAISQSSRSGSSERAASARGKASVSQSGSTSAHSAGGSRRSR